MKKQQFCPECGDEIGFYDQPYPYADTCGKTECEREVRRDFEAADEEARQRAEDDGYSRYGGFGP